LIRVFPMAVPKEKLLFSAFHQSAGGPPPRGMKFIKYGYGFYLVAKKVDSGIPGYRSSGLRTIGTIKVIPLTIR